MGKYINLLEESRKVKQELKNLVDSFPKEKREEVLFDKWSLKDVLAHLSHWMEDDLRALVNLKKGKKSYWHPSVEEFNQSGVSKRKNWEWDRVYSEFSSLIESLDKTYKSLSDEQFSQSMWENHPGDPTRSLRVDIEHWEGEHITSIKKVLKDLADES